MNRLIALVGAALCGCTSILFLAACSAVELPSATAIPTPQAWHVSYPSELARFTKDFESCLDPDWNAGLILEETQNLNPTGSTALVVLSWGDIDPLDQSAYQLGVDQLLVVVNPQSNFSAMTSNMLQGVYEGSLVDWSEIDPNLNGEIHAWIYPEHLTIQQVFLTSLPGLDLFTFLNIVPDVTAMLDAVGQDPQAIGVIPASWVDHRLRVLSISAWSPPMVPIVALVKPGAPDLIHSWLKCLSARLPG